MTDKPEHVQYLLQFLQQDSLQGSDLIFIYLSYLRGNFTPHVDVIKTLAEKGAPIDTPISDGTTPLMMAIDRLRDSENVTELYKIIQYLIQEKANLLGSNHDLKKQNLNLINWVLRATLKTPNLIGPLAMIAPYAHSAYDPLIITFLSKIQRGDNTLEWLQTQPAFEEHIPYFEQYLKL